jgi:agmatine deiminase
LLTKSHLPQMLYRMPAEWEKHTATWLAWPHFEGDWPGKFEPIQWVYAEIIRNLGRHERVDLIVPNRRTRLSTERVLKRANAWSRRVRLHTWPTDRVWTRDSGCTFTAGLSDPRLATKTRPRLCAVKWEFNGWAKYKNYKHDNDVGWKMAEAAGADWTQARDERRASPVILEGGSIDSNGQGVLLTTEECLLSKVQQRNPGYGREDYERLFSKYLGVEKVIWLGRGIEGDDTHGHVDDITRFVAADTIVTAIETDPRDKNYAPLQDNLRRLQDATDPQGRPFRIVELPMPSPVFFEGRRLPASYGNFYIANGIVLVPVFNDPKDRIALNMLADLFPGREIVPIYSGDLIWGFGAMHCMTQQQPAVPGD